MLYQVFRQSPAWERPPKPSRFIGCVLIEQNPRLFPFVQSRVIFVDGPRPGVCGLVLVR